MGRAARLNPRSRSGGKDAVEVEKARLSIAPIGTLFKVLYRLVKERLW